VPAKGVAGEPFTAILSELPEAPRSFLAQSASLLAGQSGATSAHTGIYWPADVLRGITNLTLSESTTTDNLFMVPALSIGGRLEPGDHPDLGVYRLRQRNEERCEY
jgi:hypothetical protein